MSRVGAVRDQIFLAARPTNHGRPVWVSDGHGDSWSEWPPDMAVHRESRTIRRLELPGWSGSATRMTDSETEGSTGGGEVKRRGVEELVEGSLHAPAGAH